jgi:hypothetical protein
MKKRPAKNNRKDTLPETLSEMLLKHRFDGKPLIFPVTVNLRVEPATAALLIEAAWRMKITVPEAAEKILTEIEVLHETVADFLNELREGAVR